MAWTPKPEDRVLGQRSAEHRARRRARHDQDVLAAVRKGMGRVDSIATESGLVGRDVSAALVRLRAAGLIEHVQNPRRWRVVDAPDPTKTRIPC